MLNKTFACGKCSQCEREGLVVRNPFYGLHPLLDHEWFCNSCLGLTMLLSSPIVEAKADDNEARIIDKIYSLYMEIHPNYYVICDGATRWTEMDFLYKTVVMYTAVGKIIRKACDQK